MAKERKTIFLRGAEHGIVMGLVFILLFFCMVFCLDEPVLGLVAMLLVMMVPVLTYVLLRRSYVSDMGLSKFSELWMEGIVTFAGGSLILAVIAFLYMRVINPTFLYDQFVLGAAMMAQRGDQESANMIKLVVEKHLLPTPSDIAIELLWLGAFTGSLLSMLMSLLVKVLHVRSSDDTLFPPPPAL